MMWEDIMAFVAILIAAVGVCIIWCMAPAEVEEGDNVAAAGRRRGRWPGSQRRRPAPGRPQQLVYFFYPAAPDTEGGGGTAGGSVVVCAICLEALVGGAECSEVPACRHVFHRCCLALWIKSKSTCPLCRELVAAGSEPLTAAEAMV
ncbi:RING-H2 finger protein ATL39-like [Triticum aestivum]|uniref:RING-H2 finger protein ATL39-like n=1 Tax=Triticum aestivum TaxID=4565 RepID=UPI00162C4189|nr:RING-H2 finger protein ATL39-like [Triticum aestivum]